MKDKIVLITGGASGIGKATALLFARQGAKICISDVDDRGGEEALSELRKISPESIFVHADTSNHADSEKTIRKIRETFGRLDVAVNNAGVGGDQNPIAEYSIEKWEQVIGINLSGVFYGMKYQLPLMLENGGGAIVNIGSILSTVGTSGAAGYVAAKHGVLGLTRTCALEYASKGIKCNAIGPGYIKTPLIDENMTEEQQEELVKLHPEGRLGKPEEVAELALWLAGDQSRFANGAYYPIDGGYLAQ